MTPPLALPLLSRMRASSGPASGVASGACAPEGAQLLKRGMVYYRGNGRTAVVQEREVAISSDLAEFTAPD